MPTLEELRNELLDRKVPCKIIPDAECIESFPTEHREDVKNSIYAELLIDWPKVIPVGEGLSENYTRPVYELLEMGFRKNLNDALGSKRILPMLRANIESLRKPVSEVSIEVKRAVIKTAKDNGYIPAI